MGTENVATNAVERACSDLGAFFRMYRGNENNFLNRYVTMNEMCVHHCEPEKKCRIKNGKTMGLPLPASKKLSAGKIMTSVFRDAKAAIFVDYLAKGSIITGAYYANPIAKLRENFKGKRRKEMLFYRTTDREASSPLQWLPFTVRGSNWSDTRRIHQHSPSVTSGSCQNLKNIFVGRQFQGLKKWWILWKTGLRGLEKSSSWKLLRCWRTGVRSAIIYRRTVLKIRITCIFISLL